MTFPHTLLVRSLIMAISMVIPIKGWAEISILPPEFFSESLTTNYSLAIRGGHANIPSDRQSSPSRSEGSTNVFNSFPKTLNTQSSSSVQQLEEEQRPNPFSVVVDEEVPSYIIHEPALRHREAAPQEAMNPASPPSDDQQVKNQEPRDSQDKIAHSPVPQSPLSISQRDRLPSFSRFDWPTLEQNLQLFPQGNVSEISSQWPVETGFTRLSRGSKYLARFVDVLNSDWEPTAQETFSEYGTIPLVINDAVDKNLRYFQEGIADRFQSYLDRFHHYKEIVEPIFREFGLPTELMYLSLVESGFNPRAFSRARASGPWQFMKATGRMYKLNVSWYVDERRDPIKSTVAAAHHLRDLYDRFGSWPLALAAYNAGSGKVSRAIRKTGTRDFWKIRRTWYIRRETKDYVPRFIAATLIAKNPTAYGFLAPEGDRHEFEEVLIGKPVQLSAISKQTGISFEELKRLNPELRRNIVPRAKSPGYHLKVPVGLASLVAAHHATLPVWTQPPPPPTQWYRVRRGDSLSVVARRFGMKVRQLKNMNHLSSNLIRVGAKLRVRTGVDDEVDLTATWYRVRYGDSLGKIAHRFRTSVRQIKKLNNLSTHLIYPGDRLRVQGTPQPQKSQIYRVRYGDSLDKIANRFGTSVRNLKRLNKLSTHLIYPGDRLRVTGTSTSQQSQTSDPKWYRVRRGDSLWTIAQQFRMSVRDLQALNKLSSSIIRAGHMLMVSH